MESLRHMSGLKRLAVKYVFTKVDEMKKRLLIFAHYYHPDVASTGQILKELAEGMSDVFDITVVCVVPSYEGTIAPEYMTKKYYFETLNGVRIIRVRVPEFRKTSKLSRIRNIASYFFRALVAAKKAGRQDYIFAISQPPILGGLLGVIGKWLKRAKLIYNIQDFNPEQTIAINYFNNKLVLGLMMFLDKFTCRRSDKVIVVGRDMIQTLRARFKGRKVPNYACINNWIDEKEIYPLPSDHPKVIEFKKRNALEGKFIFMYSGNIGLYYDLENLIKVFEKFRDFNDVAFVFVGAGSVKAKLEKYALDNKLSNITFIPYQDKDELIYSLNAADCHLCVNARGIKGVSVPSKIYGIMAAGRPVLGVLEAGSEARMIIEDAKCGFVAEPGNYAEIEALICLVLNNQDKATDIEAGAAGREYVVGSLTKSVSIGRYIEEINNTGHAISEKTYEQQLVQTRS